MKETSTHLNLQINTHYFLFFLFSKNNNDFLTCILDNKVEENDTMKIELS